MYESFEYTAHAVSVVPELPSCRAAELPSCRAAELPSCRADFGEGAGCQAFSRIFRSLFTLLVGLVFSGISGFAQFTIPPGFYNQPTLPAGAYEWSGAAGSEDWEDADNWVGGDAPPELGETALLFGSAAQGTGPIKVDFGTSYPWFGSLWFEGGRDVTLSYDFDTLWLGYGLSVGDHLFGIFTGKPVKGNWPSSLDDFSAVHHSQVNIDADVEVRLGGRPTGTYDLVIENATRGGLRFNGKFALGDLAAGDNLVIRGHGATNFAGRIDGFADIVVRNAGWPVSWFGGSGTFAGGQLVLSADSSGNPADLVGWFGRLIVDQGVAVVRANGALGSSDSEYNVEVHEGGVLSFRSSHRGPDLGVELDYTKDARLSLTGNGVWRSFGSGWTGALHNDGGENRFGGKIDFWGETGFGSVGGNLTLTGKITGTGRFVKWGGGVITLENEDNSWVEQTLLRGGVLRIAESADALTGGFGDAGTGPNLAFAGGLLEIGVDTDFTRGLGAGAGQVQWLGDGGFSAYGGARTVTLGDDGTGTGSSLVWGSGSFVPTGSRLLLGSAYSDSSIKFTNAIDLGSEQREVRVERGRDDSLYAELSGIISGAGGGIIKSGRGNLWLTNTGNTYTGPTIIRDGVLRGELPSDSNLQFDGIPWQRMNLVADPRWKGRWNTDFGPLMTQAEYPVYALDADFTRSLGAGPGQVRWTGSGGFAAYGEDRTVMLNNSTDTVLWGYANPHFVAPDYSLVFGSRDSDATVVWNTKLSGVDAYLAVIQGADPDRAAVRFTQQITTQNFELYGGGRADFSVDSALLRESQPGVALYQIFIKGAELRLNEQGSLGMVENIDILNGTLTLDNTVAYRSGRIPFGHPLHRNRYGVIKGDGLTLRLLGRKDSGSTVDKIGYIDIITGTIDVVNNRSDNYTELSIGQFYNGQFGTSYPAFVHFVNSDDTNGTYSDSGNTPRVRFENPKALIHGIYPWAIVNELDFAALRNNYIVPYIDYDTGDPSAWTNVNGNASPVADGSISSSKSLNSLRLINGRSLNLADGISLTMRTLLSTGTGENFIHGGSLTINNTLYPYTNIYTYAPLTITGKFNYNMLYKAGPRTLTLSGGTSNGGGSMFIMQEGMLVLNSSVGHAVSGRVNIGQNSILRVDRDNQFAPNTYVALKSSVSYDRATLLFNGENGRGLTQRFDTLAVQNGIIDFQGGTVGNPNFLIVNVLRPFYEGSAGWGIVNIDEEGTIELWIKNWFEYEDYFLVRRHGLDLARMQQYVLPYITFEGYAQGARFRYYDADYYEIVPFPEPATYGAMLGGAGLGLVFLRKRTRRRVGTITSGGLTAGRRF